MNNLFYLFNGSEGIHDTSFLNNHPKINRHRQSSSNRKCGRDYASLLGRLHAEGYILVDTIDVLSALNGYDSYDIQLHSNCRFVRVLDYLRHYRIPKDEQNIQRALMHDISGGFGAHIMEQRRYLDEVTIEAKIRVDMYKARYRSVENPIVPYETYFKTLRKTSFPAFRE